ncbi:uncharacterized protein LOC109830673 [Asparagus officinalis]|uniref:uncharacterized protein LOC109830673 n=1 Tax=Asparagus officinalis TaxID=4686 RepID=UPI00098E3149|nr:uncharacterized protein LOC109830673 [Asparagus officinalis]
MLEHAERVKAIEIYVDHAIDEPTEVIIEDYDVLLLEDVSQPISESQTQPVEAQEDMQMPQATTPKKKGTIAGPRRSTPRKATVSANEKRTPKKATPKRKVTYPSTSRKKLTPRRATKLSTSSETLPQQVSTASTSLDELSTKQSSPSSDSDDSLEDENYRIDPREAFVDDDFDEDELFGEFSNNGKGEKKKNVQEKEDDGAYSERGGQ